MNVHVLQHASFESIAGIEPFLIARDAKIAVTHFYETTTPPVLPSLAELDLVIAMGGPMSVNDEGEFPWLVAEKQFIRDAVRRGTPVLGVCLGAQLIASALGARVYRNTQKEIGWFPIEALPALTDSNGFSFPDKLNVFHWHGETFDLPAGAVHLVQSAACKHQAFQVGRRTIALQFHLEVTPAAVQAFVDNCGDELRPAPFVQTKSNLLASSASTYHEANTWMGRVIDYLVE